MEVKDNPEKKPTEQQQLQEIEKQIKKLNKIQEEKSKPIELLGNEIGLLQVNINKVNQYRIRLERELYTEYRKIQIDSLNVNKKLDRSFKVINNAIQYRKDRGINKDVEKEVDSLTNYMKRRFNNTEQIKDLKSHIVKAQLNINELNKKLQTKQNEYQVKMVEYNQIEQQINELKEQSKELEKQLRIKVMGCEKEMKCAELKKEILGGGKKKKKVRRHKGINKSTGRLKKGYYYTGKKLKSGIAEIKKIK